MERFKGSVKKAFIFTLGAGLIACFSSIAAQAMNIYLYRLSNGMKKLPYKPMDFSLAGIIHNVFSHSGLVISIILFGLFTLIYE